MIFIRRADFDKALKRVIDDSKYIALLEVKNSMPKMIPYNDENSLNENIFLEGWNECVKCVDKRIKFLMRNTKNKE